MTSFEWLIRYDVMVFSRYTSKRWSHVGFQSMCCTENYGFYIRFKVWNFEHRFRIFFGISNFRKFSKFFKIFSNFQQKFNILQIRIQNIHRLQNIDKLVVSKIKIWMDLIGWHLWELWLATRSESSDWSEFYLGTHFLHSVYTVV